MPRPRTFTTRVRIEGTVHIRVDPRRPLTNAEINRRIADTLLSLQDDSMSFASPIRTVVLDMEKPAT